MKHLSKAIVDDAIVLLRQGQSTRKVSKALGISIGSAVNIRKQDKENIPEPRMGHPYMVSQRTRRYVARAYDTGRIRTRLQGQRLIQSIEGVRVHGRTVDRYLAMEGLKTYVEREKPKLTKDQKAARRQFANDHLHWTVDDWKNVMFSDESAISRIGSYGRKFYRRRPGNMRPESNPTKKRVQGGGGKMMIWGCMTYNGLGDLSRLPQGLDSELYAEVLKDYVIASRDYRNLNRAKFIFQQDNAKVHTAKIVKEYFIKSKIQVMNWPSNSPDLNPIELVWAYLKQQLDRYENDPESMDELWERVQDVWNKIPEDFIHHLYESMPTRMKMVRRSRGAPIDY